MVSRPKDILTKSFRAMGSFKGPHDGSKRRAMDVIYR
jgi:hypothetical protein